MAQQATRGTKREVSERTREQAIKALDGMAQIVRNERLTKGEYVSEDVDPALSTAICQGHRYCAIGSLWAGAGVRVEVSKFGPMYGVGLPGAAQEDRSTFLRPRHGLRVAYEALNTAADRFIKRNKIDDDDLDESFAAPVEALFEGGADIGRDELLKIIRSAKASL